MKLYEIFDTEVLEKAEIISPISSNVQRMAREVREIDQVIKQVKARTTYSVSREDLKGLQEISKVLQKIISENLTEVINR